MHPPHSLRLRCLFLGLCLLAGVLPAQLPPLATATPRGQRATYAALAAGIAKAPAAARDGAASAFAPADAHPTVELMVTKLATGNEERDALRQAFVQSLDALAEQAAAAGVENDMAGGLALFVAGFHQLTTGRELGDAAAQNVAWQLQAALDTRAVRRLPAADKQAVHEWAVCTTVFLMALAQTAEEGGEKAQRTAVVSLAGQLLGELFGVDPARISIGDEGLAIGKAVSGDRPKSTDKPTAADQSGAAAKEAPAGTFPTPPGWSESAADGMRALSREILNEFGAREAYQLLVLSPRPRAGSPNDSFLSVFAEALAPAFDRKDHVLPLLRRLRNGCACAYDNFDAVRRQDGQQVRLGLFVVDDGRALHPVVAVYQGFRDSLEDDFGALLHGFTGSADKSDVPLFRASDLVGSWRAGANSLADFVDPATGNYRGDASILWGETLTIAADGTYVSSFVAVQGSRRIRERQEGTWQLDDAMLTMTPKPGSENAKVQVRCVCGLAPTPDGQGRILMLSKFDDKPIPFPRGSSGMGIGEPYRLVK
ncbi:MAG: hypothetical protein FJ265_02615 [Planctomycetes bacterium]|nr:hypothetical protein [Planctomycetota bacterium]